MPIDKDLKADLAAFKAASEYEWRRTYKSVEEAQKAADDLWDRLLVELEEIIRSGRSNK